MKISANINRVLFTRVAVLWLGASVVVGGLAFYVEMERIDELVLELGLNKAYALDPDVIAELPQMSNRAMVVFQREMNRLVENEFVIAEVYDRNREHLAAAVRKGSKKVDQALAGRQHKFPLEGKEHYEKFYIDQQLYIQVLVPLLHRDETVGYFEGVYRVEPAVLKAIESRVYHTLLLVLVLILATFIMLYPLILYLNRQILRYSNDLFKANTELLEVMGSAVAKRDSVTDSHNYRVTLYALNFGEALKLGREAMGSLLVGAFLHDVGKIGIEDNILCKPGRLTKEEFARMQQHVVMGVDIIDKADWLHGAREVIEYHHEKYDGSGYMRGLSGNEIPLLARMFAIVDVFDALATERPYKQALELDEVMSIMREQRGAHFDPQLLDLFLELAPGLYKKYGRAEYDLLRKDWSADVCVYFFTCRVGPLG